MTTQQRYKEKQRLNGLCESCPTKVQYPHTKCKRHLEDMRDYSRKNRKERIARRRAEGLCTKCTSELDPILDEGLATCLDCRSRARKGKILWNS